MGVRGLQTTLRKNVPNGATTINILQEINDWKRLNPNQEPLIVIDVMGILRVLSKTDYLFGCRHQIIVENYEQFLKTLADEGVRMTFFTDGPVQSHKRAEWIRRQHEKYENVCKLFDKLDKGIACANVMYDDCIPSVTDYLPAISEISKRYSFFTHISMDAECDAEIAYYANENNAIAIIADDSDFLIFEGNWKLWSGDNIDIQNMTTREYSRSALRNYLGLSQKQMPILATLSGTDYITWDDLKMFHSLCGRPWEKFLNIARAVQQIGKSADSLNEADIQYIATSIIKNVNPNVIKAIKTSLDSYKPRKISTVNYSDPLLELLKKHAMLFGWVTGHTQSITLSYFDLRRNEFMRYTDLILPIFQRQSGIILKHKNDIKIKTEYYVKFSHQDLIRKISVLPEYPPFDLPPIVDLIDGDSVPENIKWKILLWSISVHDVNYPEISSIPNGYITAVLVLCFLVKKNQITISEADGLLITIDQAKNGNIAKNISHPEHIQTRTIMISHLYCKVHNVIRRSFYMCGLKTMRDNIMLDGVYFCNLMENLKSSEQHFGENLMENILNLRIYANN